MAALAQWLMGLLRSFLTWLYNHLISLLQAVFDSFIDFCIYVIGMFPQGDPTPDPGSSPVGPVLDVMLDCLNWLFPVSYYVTLVAFLVSGMLAYVVIMPLARWLKLLT